MNGLIKRRSMIQIVWSVLFLVSSVNTGVAQDDENCGKPTNKKVDKLLQQSFDRKYKPAEQFGFLKQAVQIEEECAYCYYLMAERSKASAEKYNTSYTKAIGYYKDVLTACPTFHSDVYYQLGAMYYGMGDRKNAKEYFKQYVAFDDEDSEKYSTDYEAMLSDVKSVLEELEFYEKFYNSPVPFDPHVVGGVSSPVDEYLPMISPDNELIFYTRKVDKTRPGDIKKTIVEELTSSGRPLVTGNFDKGVAMPPPFNMGQKKGNYGGVSISLDNREMFICACEQIETSAGLYNNCDIFVTRFEKVMDMNKGKYVYKWSDLQDIGPAVNGKTSWEAQPSISSDGKTLYFATSRPGTMGEEYGNPGDIDIYSSTRDENGKWSPAKSLGPTINTPYTDKTPYMHSDSRTLYFSSSIDDANGRNGAGGMDIFYSKMNADGSWAKPKNIGYPINTKADEPGLIVSTDGQLAYFASDRVEGANGYDVYSFKLHKDAQPDKVAIAKGKLVNEKGEPETTAKVELRYEGSDKVEEVKVNKDDGSYAVVVNLEKEKDAILTVKKEGHAPITELITPKMAKTIPIIKKKEPIVVERMKVGKPYKINDIIYTTASFELDKHSKFVIDQFINFLKENPSVKVSIHGHTDNEGNATKNQILSENRAKGVMAYITSKGVSGSRLKSRGFGQTKPKFDNDTEAHKALNRRTEFVITAK
jgi:outer membrane protein OmpA-like peptidoglycan-associated protein